MRMMAPTTRSRAAAPSHLKSEPEDVQESLMSDLSENDDASVEVHLSMALKGARKLRKELESLREENAELEKKLGELEQSADVSLQPKRGRKGGPTVASLSGEVRRLKKQVHTLEKSKEKARATIKKLRISEIKKDAAELADSSEADADDSAYHMKKLLRRFHDVISSPSIAEEEQCAICFESLRVNECMSLPCEHTFCKSCLSQVTPDSEIVPCPQCRNESPRDEAEIIRFTASQQWDALLEVAKQWAKIDVRRQVDTSEEEAEENFIDDQQSEAEVGTPASVSTNPLATSPEPEANQEHGTAERNTLGINGAQSVLPRAGKGRRVATSHESSPLSSPPSPESEQDHRPNTLQEVQDGSSTAANGDSAQPVAGPSGAITPPHRAPSPGPSSQPVTPSYVQSPAAEKRRRLEMLAARKRKRPL